MSNFEKERIKMTGQHMNADGPVGTNFEVHATGAMRSTDADNERFDLIPQRMLRRVAASMSEGARKYGEHNWEKGFKWSSLINHLMRHSYLYLIGDKTEDHLAHMVCNLGFLMEFETTHPELNDIPSRMEKEVIERPPVAVKYDPIEEFNKIKTGNYPPCPEIDPEIF